VDIFNLEKGVVSDWKTTSQAWPYAKTPEKLATFGQPLAYAKALYEPLGDYPEAVDFQHIYVLTRGKPKGMEVWARGVPWSRVEDAWAETLKIADQMVAVITNHENPEGITPTVTACKKYGGCQHANYCSASPINFKKTQHDTLAKLGASMSVNNPGSKERLAALRQKLGVKDPQATEAPVSAATQKAESPPEAQTQVLRSQFQTILDSLGHIPSAVADTMVSAHPGVHVFQITEAMGLTNVEGKFVPKPKTSTSPAFKAGSSFSDFTEWAQEAGVDVREALAELGLDNKYGILVPDDFEGSVTEAYATFRPGTKEGVAAAAIEKAVEDSTVVEEPPPEEKKSVVALVDETAAAPTSDTGDIVAADHLVSYLQEHGGGASKSKAASVVREVLEGVKRIRSQRWDSIIAASEGRLAWVGGSMRLIGFTAGPEEPKEPKVVDKTPEGLASALTPLEPGEVPGPRLKAPPSNGRMVYIDAIPIGRDYTDFSLWVSQFEEAVEAEAGVLHYGVIQYAQGPQRVASMVKAVLHSQGAEALPEALYLNSWHPLAPVVLPVLQRTEGIGFVKGVK